MPSEFAEYFDDPEHSDVQIIITSQSAVAATDNQTQGSDATCRDQSITRTLHGHKVVLSCQSKYFKACLARRWQSQTEPALARGGGDGSNSDKGSKRTHEEMEKGTPKARLVINVASADLLPLAVVMVEYMYRRELGQKNILDLLKLIQLADEYGVETLISECVKHARDVGFEKWSAEAKLAAVRLPEPLLVNQGMRELVAALKEHLWMMFSTLIGTAEQDDGSSSSCAAASSLVDCLLGDFLPLEAAWNDKERHDRILSLPFAAVEALLGRNDLKVASENIVLVVALSWLRHQGSAVMNERGPQLLRKVRFPQLRPWMIALLSTASYSGPADIRDLLSDGVMDHVGWYLAADERQKQRLQKRLLCKDWAKPRERAAAQVAMEVNIQMSGIEQLANSLMDDDKDDASVAIALRTSVHIDGLKCTPMFFLSREPGGSLTRATVCIGMLTQVCVEDIPLVASYGKEWPVEVSRKMTAEFVRDFPKTFIFDKSHVRVGRTGGRCTGVGLDLNTPTSSLADHVQNGELGPIRLTFEIL